MLTEIDRDTLLSRYRALLLPRVIEDKMLRLIRQGRISKWFSGYGQEAIAVGCALALEADDYIFPTHRNLGVWTTRGVPLKPLFCQLMGREGGYTKGRDRTFHFGLPDKRIIGMISHMAAMLPVACGVGLASVYRREGIVALAFCGEGASREGDFHEALNLAAVWHLPVVFVVENNGYGLSTPTAEAMAVKDIALAAAGYGMAGEVVDGNDLEAVLEAVGQAARRAREGEGPTLLEMKTFRMRGHEEASGTRYVPDELLREWAGRDPLTKYARLLDEGGQHSGEQLADLRRTLEAEVDEAAEFALRQPPVTSTPEAEYADVFALSTAPTRAPEGSTTNKRFIDAVSDGIAQVMEEDESVILLGQDVAAYGGVFKVTKDLFERFGPDRIRNTPIIESGAIGAAMGAALRGLKPIVEMQYADFITCGFNQIVSNLATTRYRWHQPINVTIRAPYGGNIGAGPFHSQSIEAWFAHVPGLKVVVPGSPQDAKGLLMAAVADPNPVLVFEHKYLYRALKGDVTDAPFETPLGKARVERSGEDLSIVTWGLGVLWAAEEAGRRANEGVSIEIIDLRTIVPWDRESVFESVRKTGRVIVLHEATLTGGFGGEIAAAIAEALFEALDAPPTRVAGADIPIPFSTQLENEVFSAKARLAFAVDQVLAY
jgi:2-oxoisovalerate dehydrogenase E1 component